jgi:hypothetical protein
MCQFFVLSPSDVEYRYICPSCRAFVWSLIQLLLKGRW